MAMPGQTESPLISFRHFSYTYPEAPAPVLRDVTLELPVGSCTLVMGPSGAGKSTLLRSLNGLVPHFSGGTVAGQVRVAGLNPVALGPQRMSHVVGFVFQDPEAQFVAARVEDEIALGLENAAVPRAEMHARVEQVLTWLDLLPLRQRKLTSLSGGEQQRVAIAASLALNPQILVLDEPTSQLDAESAASLLQLLARLRAQLRLTVVLVEHRLERVLPFCSHGIFLPDAGAPVLSGPPEPLLARVGIRPGHLDLPLAQAASSTTTVIDVTGLTVGYGDEPVLRELSLQLRAGEIVALRGRNGAGKTTLLKTLVGLLKPTQGRITVLGEDIRGRSVADICRNVAYLPQWPDALLFADSVIEELWVTLRNHHLDDRPPVAPPELLARLGIADKAASYPRDLSVGERQRVALGAVLVTRPAVLLLDEPTRGLDYEAKRQLGLLLRSWRDAGMAILIATHDVPLVRALADREIWLCAGT